MSKPPTSKDTLHVKAYQEIKTETICLKPKPGEKISENEIAKGLKISRTPVREALLILENEKLVECDDRLGVAVKKLTTKEVEEYFQPERLSKRSQHLLLQIDW
jgi:GntR family transcriptional regulator, rspAB operon transcriptional repressor